MVCVNGEKVTPARLKSIPILEQEITRCADDLDHGNLICDASVREWATRAKGILPADELEKAMRAVEDTRQRIKKRMENGIRERDALMGWISSIQREDIRASVFLRFAKGYSYDVIAEQYFGGSIKGESVRKMCNRCIYGKHQGKIGRPRKEGGQNDTETA